jgi:hypothetical protein
MVYLIKMDGFSMAMLNNKMASIFASQVPCVNATWCDSLCHVLVQQVMVPEVRHLRHRPMRLGGLPWRKNWVGMPRYNTMPPKFQVGLYSPLSIYLPTYLCIYLSIYLYISISISIYLHLYLYLDLFLSNSLYLYLSLSNSLYLGLAIHIYICIYIYI